MNRDLNMLLWWAAQVFCETKRGCDSITRQLRQDGFPALCIHGDKSQQERDWVLMVGTNPRSPQLGASRLLCNRRSE